MGLVLLSGFAMWMTPGYYKKSEFDKFFDHISNIDPNIKFTQEGLSDHKLAFLDLQFESNHPLI